MSTEFFNDNHLDKMSPITFKEFNSFCQVIDPEEQHGSLLSAYALGVEGIKNNFKYPHYYNCVMALFLLFSNDDSYKLIGCCRINHIWQETKELAVTGYADFCDIGMNSLHQLIATLGTMANVFRTQYCDYQSIVIKDMYEKDTNPVDLDHFQTENGITTQIKPIDYSINIQEGLNSETPQLLPMTSVCTQNEELYVMDVIKGFQKAYISVTSTIVLSTIAGNHITYSRIFLYILYPTQIQLPNIVVCTSKRIAKCFLHKCFSCINSYQGGQ